MGDSKPPKAQFDLIGSYARRRGADVEIVLVDPADDVAALTGLVLRRAGRDVTATVTTAAEGAGTEQPGNEQPGSAPARLVARVPRSQLSDGIWNIRRTADGGDEQRLNARLLVQGDRPLVLLWGELTKPSRVPKAVRHLPVRNQVAAHAGGALHAAIDKLPAEQADKLRKAVRTRARRALR